MIKKYFLLVLFVFVNYSLFSQVEIDSPFPNFHAQLDVTASKKGILIPRVVLSDITKPDPFDTTEKGIPESLLVYNKENEGSNIVAGYYYWRDGQWNKIIVQSDLNNKDFSSSHLNIIGGKGAGLKEVNFSINNNVITTNMLKDKAITGNKIAVGNITRDKIQYNAIVTDHIENSAITTDKLRVGSVTPFKIQKGGNNTVLITNEKGLVSWADWANLINKTLSLSHSASYNGSIINKESSNIAIGDNVLLKGSYNVAIGFGTPLDNTTSGSSNIAIGNLALYKNTTGKHNTAIGHESLFNNTTGIFNTCIGSFSNVAKGVTNATSIGYEAVAPDFNTIMLGNKAITGVYTYGKYYSNGALITSDRRYKQNIQMIPLGLDFINKIQPVEYIRKNDIVKTKEWGIIAQELQTAITESGYKNAGIIEEDHTENKYLSVAYSQLIAPIIKAIQELSQEEQVLKTELLRLKQDILVLKNKK